jgi:hypothetical protein
MRSCRYDLGVWPWTSRLRASRRLLRRRTRGLLLWRRSRGRLLLRRHRGDECDREKEHGKKKMR